MTQIIKPPQKICKSLTFLMDIQDIWVLCINDTVVVDNNLHKICPQMSVLVLMPHNNNNNQTDELITHSLLKQCSLRKQSLHFTSLYSSHTH